MSSFSTYTFFHNGTGTYCIRHIMAHQLCFISSRKLHSISSHLHFTTCLVMLPSLSLSHSLSLSLSVLTAIFPGEPPVASFIGAGGDGSGGDNWSYKTCIALPFSQWHKTILVNVCVEIVRFLSGYKCHQLKPLAGRTEVQLPHKDPYSTIPKLSSIRTFRFPLFSLLRAKVPSGNLRSQELKFPGTFIPGSQFAL